MFYGSTEPQGEWRIRVSFSEPGSGAQHRSAQYVWFPEEGLLERQKPIGLIYQKELKFLGRPGGSQASSKSQQIGSCRRAQLGLLGNTA